VTARDLDPYVEWGGSRWRRQLEGGLRWLGDVSGLRVLDLGTRHGRMAAWFAHQGAEVVGVDVSDDALDDARLFAAEHGVSDRVSFVTYSGDPRDLPKGFDVVFAKSVVVLMDIDAAVDGLADALNPGGRVLLVENARGPLPLHLLRMLRRGSVRPHGAHYFTAATIDTIRRRFEVELESWDPPVVVVGGRKQQPAVHPPAPYPVRLVSVTPTDPIPFHRPAVGDREIAAAVEVMRSGWLTTGPRAHELEAAVANRLGVKHGLAVSSATAALHLALDGLRIGPGDDVVIPTMTFTACGEVCAYLGARVVLADVGEDALLGPAQLEASLTDGTRAVMPVHFAGQGVDIAALRKVAPDRRFVEDAAHAFPASVAGVPVGRLGDAAAFSFYATKTMTTGGEGGMLVTDDDMVAARARLMRLHGISADAWNRYGAGGTWAYEVAEAGYKYNLSDLAAAIGLVQLERLDELAAARAGIAMRYDAAFADSPLLSAPPRRAGDRHAWHLYVVRLNLEALGIDRSHVIQQLAEAGIGASVHFIPLHLHSHYQQRYGYAPGDFPMAERIFERSVSIPIWPGMSDGQVDRVSSTLLEILHAARHPSQV